MKTYFSGKKTLFLWYFRISVFYISAFAAVAKVSFLNRYYWAIIALLAVAAALSLLYARQYLKGFSITLGEGAVTVVSGVFIKNEKIMPFPKHIYTVKYKTPIAAKMGVSALVLKAARVAVLVPELNEADAEEIIRALSNE